MNQNTIICHSFPAWDTPYIKSTMELMTRLTRDCRVIMVDYHYTWKDLFKNPYAPKMRLLGIESRWRRIQTSSGEIEVYNSSPVLPTNWINNKRLLNLANSFNSLILKRTVKDVTRKVGHHEATLVNAFNPVFGLITKKYWNVKRTFYYCYDEISGTSWAGKHGPDYEAAYASMVDGIICTSSHLQNEKAKLNANCHLVPNGVNLDVFQTITPTKAASRAIGYVGAVDDRIDFDLIYKLASHLEDYRVDLYGAIKTDIPAMPDNVYFHGAIPQEQLPNKISDLDICVIPFVKNNLTQAIYPLKINEYLAMGKPVVSTDFADLNDFSKLISIGTDKKGFLDAVEKEVRYNNRLKAQKRIRFAQGNSWRNRTNEFLALIQQTEISSS